MSSGAFENPYGTGQLLCDCAASHLLNAPHNLKVRWQTQGSYLLKSSGGGVGWDSASSPLKKKVLLWDLSGWEAREHLRSSTSGSGVTAGAISPVAHCFRTQCKLGSRQDWCSDQQVAVSFGRTQLQLKAVCVEVSASGCKQQDPNARCCFEHSRRCCGCSDHFGLKPGGRL